MALNSAPVLLPDGGLVSSSIRLALPGSLTAMKEEWSQELRHGEGPETVAHLLGDFFSQEHSEHRSSLGRTGRAEADVNTATNDTFGVALGDIGSTAIFADGFELGDTSAWSSTVP